MSRYLIETISRKNTWNYLGKTAEKVTEQIIGFDEWALQLCVMFAYSYRGCFHIYCPKKEKYWCGLPRDEALKGY